jgi:molybdopterin-guanine dinucleotide biosynthesis protein A
MALDPTSVAGIVLAGGQSRRMGGGDKGLLLLDDKPMLAHVIARFAPQVGTLALDANGDPGRFAAFGLPIIADTHPGYPGPLAGVLAGMLWARTAVAGAQWVASVSSDVPFLPHDVVARLRRAARQQRSPIAFARAGAQWHPVIALWSIELADRLKQAIDAGEYRVRHWAGAQGAVPVDFASISIAGVPVDPFFNANTPQELAEARALLAKGTD